MLASLRQLRRARRLLRGAANLATEVAERLLRFHRRWCSCLNRTPDQRLAEPVVVGRCSFVSGRAPVSREVRAPGHQRALRPPTLDLLHHQPHLQGLAKVFPARSTRKSSLSASPSGPRASSWTERATEKHATDGAPIPRTRPARPSVPGPLTRQRNGPALPRR